MPDERAQRLHRQAVQGDREAASELDRLSRRAGRCLTVPCVPRHAGTLDGEGDLFIARTFCWNCARLKFYGDTDDPELAAKAKEVWGKSDRRLVALALELEPMPRHYRFKAAERPGWW